MIYDTERGLMSTQRNEDGMEKVIIVEQYNLDKEIPEIRKKESVSSKHGKAMEMSSILELSDQEKS